MGKYPPVLCFRISKRAKIQLRYDRFGYTEAAGIPPYVPCRRQRVPSQRLTSAQVYFTPKVSPTYKIYMGVLDVNTFLIFFCPKTTP